MLEHRLVAHHGDQPQLLPIGPSHFDSEKTFDRFSLYQFSEGEPFGDTMGNEAKAFAECDFARCVGQLVAASRAVLAVGGQRQDVRRLRILRADFGDEGVSSVEGRGKVAHERGEELAAGRSRSCLRDGSEDLLTPFLLFHVAHAHRNAVPRSALESRQ